MRVLICGWVGSTNLGDELVLAGVRRLCGPHARLVAVSIDPAATRADHGIGAIDHRHLAAIARAARRADVVVLGGGGLVQDETSPFNLPYHLSRGWLANLGRTPLIGLALGVGPLDTRLGRTLATTLRAARVVTVRDDASAALLAEVGVAARVGADAALHLDVDAATLGPAAPPTSEAQPRPEVEASDSATDPGVLVVSLRPWSTGRGRTPVGWRGGGGEPDWFVPLVAEQLDRTVARTGMQVRFVALQGDRDGPLHARVAAAMRHPAQLRVPARHELLAQVAGGRIVVAMRYHAGVAAGFAGRPTVLIGYSPKVDALAAAWGTGAVHLPFDRAALATVDAAVSTLLARDGAAAAVRAAHARLVARTAVNRDALVETLAPHRPPPGVAP